MDLLRIGTFTRSVLVDVARSTGRLAEAGLDIQEIPVPSSPAQFTSLVAGEYDAIFTSPDNVLAYRFLPGNPLGELLDVEIVAALDRGLGLCLGARPGIDDASALRGARIGVDVPTSGFAFVAFAILARAGLEREDYEVVTLGSTPKRAAALLSGGCDATVLGAGNELRSMAAGCAILGTAAELGPYLGTVVARMRRSANEEAVSRLVDVLLAVAAEIRAGFRRTEVVASGVRVLGLTEQLASLHGDRLRDPVHGLIPDGLVDIASIQTIVDLRRAFLPAPELDGIVSALDRVVRPSALAGA